MKKPTQSLLVHVFGDFNAGWLHYVMGLDKPSDPVMAEGYEMGESLIPKGELRVVKTTRNGACNDWACDHCDRRLGGEPEFNYCPGCGAEIVNP